MGGCLAAVALSFWPQAALAVPRTGCHAELKLVTLGTGGGPLLDAKRARASNLVATKSGVLLVDAGEGSAQRLTEAGYSIADIDAIFLTHLHIDHIADLATFITGRWAMQVPGILTIYGPVGTDEVVRGILQASAPTVLASSGLGTDLSLIGQSVHVVEIISTPGSVAVSVADVAGLSVSVIENTHFDYAFDQSPRPISFSYRMDGCDSSIAFTGDTGPSQAVVKFVTGVDILVGEVIEPAVIIEKMKGMSGYSPKAIAALSGRLTQNHLSSAALGELSYQAHAGRLVVSHIVPSDLDDQHLDEMSSEIRSIYFGPVSMANDLDVFPPSELTRPIPPEQ